MIRSGASFDKTQKVGQFLASWCLVLTVYIMNDFAAIIFVTIPYGASGCVDKKAYNFASRWYLLQDLRLKKLRYKPVAVQESTMRLRSSVSSVSTENESLTSDVTLMSSPSQL